MLIFTQREPLYASEVTQSVFSISAVALSFSVAIVVSSVVEFPLSNVEEIIFKLAGLGQSESTRKSVVIEKCVVKMNEGFEENDGGAEMERRDGERVCEDGREGEGGFGGEVIVNKSVRFDGEVETMMDCGELVGVEVGKEGGGEGRETMCEIAIEEGGSEEGGSVEGGSEVTRCRRCAPTAGPRWRRSRPRSPVD